VSTQTQVPLATDLVSALSAETGDAQEPAEILLGPLTDPTRMRAGGSGSGPGIAVLFWCGSIHVLAYDPAHGHDGGCPRCLAWFLTRHVDSAQLPLQEASESDSAAGARSHALWQQAGPALRTVVTRTATQLLRETSVAGTLATVDRASGAVRQGHVPPRTGCPAHQSATATTSTKTTTTTTSTSKITSTTTVAFGSTPELLEKSDGALRTRRPLPPTLTSDYMGPHSLFREPLVDLDGPLPTAQVSLPLGNGVQEPGVGRSRNFNKSRTTAVLEALERHTGFCHQPSDGTVEASLSELGQRAIDPRTLGYHSDEEYAQHDFLFAPLDEAESVEWVPVTPLGDGPARYLPEVALSWVRRAGTRKPFFYDTSNGFALGQSYEEATLHGLFEIVERDAFLLTWYRKLLLPELTLGPADSDIKDLMARVEIVTGFQVRLFWATLDIGIPVVLALAQRDASSGPCTLVSTAASLYPRAAAESAIFEVAARVASIRCTFDDDPVHRRQLADDFGSLRTMDDHSLLGALPTSREWFSFLTRPDRPEIGLTEVAATAPEFGTLDKDLDHVRAQVEAAGSHIYAADVTTPELRWRGLVCTRSFIPGCLPMTFGHGNRRLEGLPRLHREPLPCASQLLPGQTPADVPPHPFA
jgi:ribosomal protein S12 methylthiotransferase accessory factor